MTEELLEKLIWLFATALLLFSGIGAIVKSVRLKRAIKKIINLDPKWIYNNVYEYAQADTAREVLFPIGILLIGGGLFMLVMYLFNGITF